MWASHLRWLSIKIPKYLIFVFCPILQAVIERSTFFIGGYQHIVCVLEVDRKLVDRAIFNTLVISKFTVDCSSTRFFGE